MGSSLCDFHTAQVPSGEKRFPTRKDELSVSKDELHTILSSRDYRLDGLFTIILWEKERNEWGLEKIKEKLERPSFIPYLGRKSCPSGLPFEPHLVEAETMRAALDNAQFKFNPDEIGLRVADQKMLYWDECSHSGLKSQQVFERRDIPLSRIRWQFDTRKECHASWTDKGNNHVHQ
jgi:CRISPR system Cascade subunit CasD